MRSRLNVTLIVHCLSCLVSFLVRLLAIVTETCHFTKAIQMNTHIFYDHVPSFGNAVQILHLNVIA
jgi:hypothetical protein